MYSAVDGALHHNTGHSSNLVGLSALLLVQISREMRQQCFSGIDGLRATLQSCQELAGSANGFAG
jgi:hypothetical protein